MTALSPEFLSVVVPAYNEQARLPESLAKIQDYCRSRFARFEIIVVDDGSTDGTAAAVNAAIPTCPQLRLLRLATNSGKGAAVRAGMLAATGDFVLFTDADLSTPIAEVEQALAQLAGGAAVVIGSRALPASDVQVHQNLLRESMGKTFNVFVRLLSGLPFHDTQCGFKCFTRPAAQAIFRRTTINGFAFDVETLVVAGRLGLRAVEIPVRWVNSPASKVGVVVHPLQMLRDLVRIRLNDQRGRYR